MSYINLRFTYLLTYLLLLTHAQSLQARPSNRVRTENSEHRLNFVANELRF